MDKFFERHKLGKLTQEEMNRPISIKEAELVAKFFWQRKLLAQMASSTDQVDIIYELYQTFKEEIPILHELFQKSRRGKKHFPT